MTWLRVLCSAVVLVAAACDPTAAPSTRPTGSPARTHVAARPTPSASTMHRRPPGGPRFSTVAAARVGARIVYAVRETVCPRGACPGQVVRSDDAGRTWTSLSRPSRRLDGARLVFADARRGWLVLAQGHLLVTDDGARHWRPVALRGVTAAAIANHRVYALAHHEVFAAPVAGGAFARVAAVRGDTIVAGDAAAYVYTSLEGSDTVTRVTATAVHTERLPCGAGRGWSRALTVGPRKTLVACGGEGGMGEQLKTAWSQPGFGAAWRRAGTPGAAGYVSLAFTSAAGVLVTGGRCPIYLSSAGRRWNVVRTSQLSAEGFGIGGFADRSHGWLISDDYGNRLYLTDDGGRHWRVAIR